MIKKYSYIKASEEFCTLEKHIPAPYFRRNFIVSQEMKSAKLKITGLGFYELHFNGVDITKGFLAPYRSNPEHIVYFDEYDVTDNIRVGNNVIAVLLGNGMQNALGAYIWHFDEAPWRSAPKLCFELTIEYQDGNIDTIISDSKTKTKSSPILFDDLHYGEYYDASLEIENWDAADFDDSGWKNAIEAEIPQGECRFCEADPIVLRKELKPISITEYNGGYIYDFGLNNAGLCRMNIKNSESGQKLLLQYFEMLKDGKPYLNNIRFNRDGIIDRYQEDIYYCAGRKEEEYIPHFTYHGFRYVYVTGITPEQAKEDLLTYLVFNSNIEQIGSFVCDDEIANKLQEATVRSDLSNFHYFPTDCPQREKNGWTGDASLSAEQMLLNIKPERSYREWMRNIYKTLNEKGQLPGIIPTTGWGYEWGNGPAWDGVIVNIPYYTYIYRGDKEILKELSEPLMSYLKYLESRLDENNLIAIGLGDWCQIGEQNGCPDAPLVVTDSILTADIAKKSAFIYGLLGEDEKRIFASGLEEKVRNAVRKHLIDSDTMIVKGNVQTSQAMALYYGMFEENEKEKAVAHLLKLVKDKDNHLATGVLGNRAIFRVLADYGYADLAYEMITRPDFPSFGYWITRGATTLWENFFMIDDYPVDSLNHHFWGDFSAWFYTYLAGIKINPSGNDVNEVNISPCFVEKLGYVKAKHILPAGEIEVEWKRIDDEIELNLKVPQGVYGIIDIPKGYMLSDRNNQSRISTGTYIIRKNR